MAGAFYINIDFREIINLQNFKGAGDKAMKDAARNLSAMTLSHIKKQVQSKLKSRREKYDKALSIKQEGDVWIIELDSSARWIEEGLLPHEMIDDLLKKNAKTAKDGSKYKAIPMEHNKGPSKTPDSSADLSQAIQMEMKKRKIPYGPIETDGKGNPKIGKLHQFDVKTPLKIKEGAGQGWGPIQQPKQGATGIPFLNGVQVHQKMVKDAQGKERAVKAILTYRMVSSKMKGSGRWFHPGLQPMHFFDEAEQWALTEWEKMKPDIIQQVIDSL